MTRKWVAAYGMLFFLLLAIVGLSSRPAAAQSQPAPSQQQEQKPAYTIAEYNAFQAARGEKDPQARLRLLDDFVVKFPASTLEDRINFAYTRSATFQAIFNPKDANVKEELDSARQAADLGLKLLNDWKKPATLTDDQYTQQKKLAATTFNSTGGFVALQQKDYKAAVNYFTASLAITPNDALTYYRLGLAYLLQEPAKSMEGFWSLARAIALKAPGEAQVRDYLRKRMLAYQQPGCDHLIDSQMNELIQLATSSPDRPASYSIPSADDLNKVRSSSNIVTVLTDLKGGGDKSKMTWLAVCGSEFPEVVGKVIEVTPGSDDVLMKVYTGATSEEMEAATTANMDVKIAGQPEASRLQKDDGVRFSGTLAGYDPEPFMLHWEKCKVNPEDIPGDKAAPGAHRAKRPIKKPGVR